MAAAEARTAWQRAANRCFVQEDAKRAPKLACCQSSLASKLANPGPADAVDGRDQCAMGFMPFDMNPLYANLPPDTRWWLLLQPNYGCQKDLTCLHINVTQTEVHAITPGMTTTISEVDGVKTQRGGITHTQDHKIREFSLDPQKGFEFNKEEIQTQYCEELQTFSEIGDVKKNSEPREVDAFDSKPFSPKQSEFHFDPLSQWIEQEKTEPWWRTTDGVEVANSVPRRSVKCIENCDLPPPQKICYRRQPYAQKDHWQHDKISAPFTDLNSKADDIPYLATQGQHHLKSCRTAKNETSSVNLEDLHRGSEKLLSFKIQNDFKERDPNGDSVRAELMDALRHSQTRAREAENAAKEANAEKEHIIQMFWRQASQLFAYKQWLRLLQLEILHLHVKNGNQPISTLFPVVLPCIPCGGGKLRKSWQRSSGKKRVKPGSPINDIGNYAIALALGFSLVGAGLLLGWTVGWMLQSF